MVSPSSLREYLWAALVVAACTAANLLAFRFVSLTDIAMVYLLGAALVASRYGRGPSLAAALLSIAAFDFGFVPPRYTFAVADARYVITFAVFLAIALVISTLTVRLRNEATAAETERLRTALLSSMSHDLRTPLATITGAASTLLERDSHLTDERKRALLQSVLGEAERMNRLISNLLDMIRVESGTLQVQKEWQPLEETVGVALIHLGDRARDHPIAVNLPADLPLVAGDAVLLEQVFINLLENAIKYSPAGTPIEISAEARNDSLLVTVADRGPGLAAGTEAHVFEKFYRSPQNSTAAGIGLGLTIVRGIILAHGGRVWAENRSGAGAAFRFTLPLTGPQPSVPEEAEG